MFVTGRDVSFSNFGMCIIADIFICFIDIDIATAKIEKLDKKKEKKSEKEVKKEKEKSKEKSKLKINKDKKKKSHPSLEGLQST